MSQSESASYLPISEYAVIGDCRSAALISSQGSVNWLCWPDFHNPSIFGRILDRRSGGHFTLRPSMPFRSERRYIGPTNVLETTFRTQSGTVRVVDLMPALPERMKRSRLMPLRSLLRRVDGVEGRVEMEVQFSPRPDFGRIVPGLHARTSQDITCQAGQRFLHLRSSLTMEVQGADAGRKFTVEGGERHYFGLAYDDTAPGVQPSIGEAAEEEIAATLDYWENWAGQCRYSGPYREAVIRSALALKLLTFAPSGAIVAAPTTSLPEWPGSSLNWDYRFCWLRDAAFTVNALYDLGYTEEGNAFANWIMHATRLTHPALQVLYTVYGESQVSERELTHLEGYRGSTPVRIGNAAHAQSQLDVYGEVMPALEQFHQQTTTLDSDSKSLVRGMAELVCRQWQQPDHGIWESRGQKQHYVHSKAMAWRALDSAARLCRRAGMKGDFDRWAQVRGAIRSSLLSGGFNADLGSFVRTLGGNRLDASALAFSLIGLVAGTSPQMLSTIEAVKKQLALGELVYRNGEGRIDGPGREGAFLICSFWLVCALALGGKLDEAHETFRRLLTRSNDLGLFSEEVDPATGEMLGNFPQGLTHIALITAALVLENPDRRGVI